jgi:hypothetical protein
MKVARVTVRAMIQGLMAGRDGLGATLAGSGGGGGAILTGSISVAVGILMGLPSESLWTVGALGLYACEKETD